MYDINLLPSELHRKINIDLKRLIIILLLTLLPAGLAGGYAFFLIEINHLRLEANNIDRRLEQLAPQMDRVLQLRQEREKIEQQIPALQSLLGNRFTITPILNGIADNLPVDMWITGISAEYRENYLPRGGFASPAGIPAPGQASVQIDHGAGSVDEQQPEEQQSLPPPNMLVLQGISHSPASIGVFVGKLSCLPYFQNIDLVKVHTATSGKQGLAFHIEAMLLEVRQDAPEP